MATTSEQDWKNKYFQALEQQESQETTYKARFEIMKMGLLRLSLAADGVDSKLDDSLKELRSVLRSDKGGERFGVLVSQLEETVTRLDDRKQRQAQSLGEAFEQMAAQLIDNEPPGPVKKELRNFSKAAKKRSANTYNHPLLILECARLMDSVFSGETQNVERPGLFKSLFGSDKREDKISESPETVAAGPASGSESTDGNSVARSVQDAVTPVSQEETTGLAREPATDASPTNLSDSEPPGETVASEPATRSNADSDDVAYQERTRSAISGALAELLGQIEIQKAGQDEYEVLRTRILEGLGWPSVVPSIDDIRSIMCMAFDSDREAFEEFLKSLDVRLVDVSSHLGQVIDVEQSEKCAALNESMQAQVQQIKTTVAEATELEHLKETVTWHVESITQAMGQFQQENERREQAVHEQLDTMASRVNDMELESRSARKKLEDQRQRLLEDTLTRLPNRIAYDETLEREHARWGRYQRPLSLVVGDIDLFKQVNDRFGHLAGDTVLQGISKVLASKLRKTDFVARFGGEEFVFLLPETSEEQALIAINSIRTAISELVFHFGQSREAVGVSMSFGIAGFRKDDAGDAVFERADKAMYQAKQAGRDRCVIAPDDLETSEED